MLVSVQEMRALEAAALAAGPSEDALMTEAGTRLAAAVRQFFPKPGRLIIFAGKGHNAGDAFVAAAALLDAGWSVSVRLAFPEADFRPLARQKWDVVKVRVTREVPADGALVLMDGLLGIGASGGLGGPVLDACREMNQLRTTRHAITLAVDVPTGLDADTGTADPDAVVADWTFTIGAAKRGLAGETMAGHVGRLVVVPVAALTPSGPETAPRVLTPQALRPLLPRRRFDMHKGLAGRVGIIAGSRGLLGAALLASSAAVRGGAGLVTLMVPEEIYPLIAVQTAPEVMVRPVRSCEEAAHLPFDVLAMGPGLGTHAAELHQLIRHDPRPLILDADALNELALEGLQHAAESRAPRLLTPHPGEMRRLLGFWRPDLTQATREEQAAAVTGQLGVTLLFKGARTLIQALGKPVSHNTTGHPGMASGGMGDVLTGLCAALTAQGCPLFDAACLGSWLIGRAAELALLSGTESPESLRATAILDHLGPAFNALRQDEF